MRHLLARDVVRHRGPRCHRACGLRAVHQLLELLQMRQRLLRCHPEIHQTSDLIDADVAQLVHQGQAALRRAEQCAGVVIAGERMLEQRVHVFFRQDF